MKTFFIFLFLIISTFTIIIAFLKSFAKVSGSIKRKKIYRKKRNFDKFLANEFKEDNNDSNVKEKNYDFELKTSYNEFSILKPKNIFTKYELIFFKELKEFLNWTSFILLSKVRIADMIEAKQYVAYKDFISVFNKINRKHIDFVITDIKWKILCLIELDGYSHNYLKTKESDDLKNKLFKSLNIPLIRFQNWHNHDLSKLKNLLIN